MVGDFRSDFVKFIRKFSGKFFKRFFMQRLSYMVFGGFYAECYFPPCFAIDVAPQQYRPQLFIVNTINLLQYYIFILPILRNDILLSLHLLLETFKVFGAPKTLLAGFTNNRGNITRYFIRRPGKHFSFHAPNKLTSLLYFSWNIFILR